MNKTLKTMRDKDDAALKQDLAGKMRHLFDLRSQQVTEKLENPSQFRTTRRDIARIRTILRQRETAPTAK